VLQGIAERHRVVLCVGDHPSAAILGAGEGDFVLGGIERAFAAISPAREDLLDVRFGVDENTELVGYG